MATLTAESAANDVCAIANAGPLARTPVTSEVVAVVGRAGPPSSSASSTAVNAAGPTAPKLSRTMRAYLASTTAITTTSPIVDSGAAN